MILLALYRDKILALEGTKRNILLSQEEDIRIQICAMWLAIEDKNTCFFHKYANMRKKINTIEDIWDEEDHHYTKLQDVEESAVKYFSKFYSQIDHDIEVQLEFINLVPVMFSEQENIEMGKPITKEELLAAIKDSAKEKSLGPDGWGINIFYHFWDLMHP